MKTTEDYIKLSRLRELSKTIYDKLMIIIDNNVKGVEFPIYYENWVARRLAINLAIIDLK